MYVYTQNQPRFPELSDWAATSAYNQIYYIIRYINNISPSYLSRFFHVYFYLCGCICVYVWIYVLESRGLCIQKKMLEILELECYRQLLSQQKWVLGMEPGSSARAIYDSCLLSPFFSLLNWFYFCFGLSPFSESEKSKTRSNFFKGL